MQTQNDKELYDEWCKITEASDNDKYKLIASDWHGGQSSPLYSYSSTGKVWSETHRNELVGEIESNIKNKYTDKKEIKRLESLKKHIQKFKIDPKDAATRTQWNRG